MRVSIGELRRLIREAPGGRRGFADQYFVSDIVPKLKQSGTIPSGIGQQIGYGFEAVVFTFGHDRVIRLHPTYEYDKNQADELYQRMKNAPSGGLFVEIYDVGKAEGYDKDRGENIVFAVYTIMERLTPLPHWAADIIDEAVTKKAIPAQLDVSTELTEFLQKYITMSIDQDSRNVMKRGEQYVIIDPE
jgi:hypothetical protein